MPGSQFICHAKLNQRPNIFLSVIKTLLSCSKILFIDLPFFLKRTTPSDLQFKGNTKKYQAYIKLMKTQIIKLEGTLDFLAKAESMGTLNTDPQTGYSLKTLVTKFHLFLTLFSARNSPPVSKQAYTQSFQQKVCGFLITLINNARWEHT